MKYRVTGGTASFGIDMVLTLSKDQAEVRASQLDRVAGRENAWRPRRIVQFKAGEELGVDCLPEKLPAALGRLLVPLGGAGGNSGETVAISRQKRRASGKAKAVKAGS